MSIIKLPESKGFKSTFFVVVVKYPSMLSNSNIYLL
jgi:hypothetical protein